MANVADGSIAYFERVITTSAFTQVQTFRCVAISDATGQEPT